MAGRSLRAGQLPPGSAAAQVERRKAAIREGHPVRATSATRRCEYRGAWTATGSACYLGWRICCWRSTQRPRKRELRPAAGRGRPHPRVTGRIGPDHRPRAPITARYQAIRLFRAFLAPPGPLMREAEPLARKHVEGLPPVLQTLERSDRHGRLSRAVPHGRHVLRGPAGAGAGCASVSCGPAYGDRAAARVAAATRHLTFAQLGIWQAGVAFEGADPPLGMDDASEPALARPAGLQAEAGSRLGPSYARLLEQMRARPEPVKVLVVIHDGQPDDPSTAMRKSRFEPRPGSKRWDWGWGSRRRTGRKCATSSVTASSNARRWHRWCPC